MKQYETVIGLEVHVELATKTKIFSGCTTKFGGEKNTHTCPVCAGLPGSLPVLNKQVVEYAMAVGLATNCTINQNCRFDRKNYFYPDNPQDYQISQLYEPICLNGHVDIEVNGVENLVKLLGNDTKIVTIFLKVPKEELRRRLESRIDKPSPKDIELRLNRLQYEESKIGIYDYVIKNNNLEKTVNIIMEIIKSEYNMTEAEF